MIKFLTLLFPLQLMAMPNVLEVWFVQEKSKVVSLSTNSYIAQNSYQCIKVGTNCFDPQIGLYDPKKLKETGAIELPEAIHEDEWDDFEKDTKNYDDISTLDVVKRSALQCDKTNFFDVFCGKAKRVEMEKVDLEVYIDATESMGRLDPTDLKKECYRSSLVRRVLRSCASPSVYIFNHSRKKIQNPQDACEALSITDDSRLIQWVKSSKAKKLVIVTEKSEVGKKFLDFATLNLANFRGEKLGEELQIQQLPNEFTRLKKTCRN